MSACALLLAVLGVIAARQADSMLFAQDAAQTSAPDSASSTSSTLSELAEAPAAAEGSAAEASGSPSEPSTDASAGAASPDGAEGALPAGATSADAATVGDAASAAPTPGEPTARSGDAPPAGEASAEASQGAPVAPVVRPPEPPWPLRPYVVKVELSFVADPVFDAAFRTRFAKALHRRLEDNLGRMWTLTTTSAQGPRVQHPGSLERLTVDEALSRWPPAEQDKAYLIVVERRGLETRVILREWDAAVRDLGPVLSRSTMESRLVVDVAETAVRDAFRPLAQVVSVGESSIALQTRAGELLPPDDSAVQISPGALLAPVYRQLDRNKQVKQVQRIPWTLLRVEAVDRARIEAFGVSVFPVAVAPSKRRMESLAIVVRPYAAETRLQVIPRGQPGSPMAGTRVDIVDRLPKPGEPATDSYTLRTDRNGIIRVPADPQPMVRYALVGSGKQMLAKVPFLPGAQAELTLEVLDDTPRLSTEGELALLEADLIELVARRQILILRTEALAKEGKDEEAAGFIERLRALPDIKAFQQRVDLVRTAGEEAAKARKDPVGESRVRRLCRTLGEIAATHLDDDKFQEQLRDLQDLAGVQAAPSRTSSSGGVK